MARDTQDFILGFLQGIAPALQGMAERRVTGRTKQTETAQAIQTFIKKLGLTTAAEKELAGYKAGLKTPKTPDTAKSILNIIAGLTQPGDVLSPEQIEQAAPLARPLAGGGFVGTPPGATIEGGLIRDAAGNVIGEATPQAQLQRAAQTIPQLLGEQFGISRKQAARKAIIGTSFKEEITPEGFIDSLENAITAIEQGKDADLVFQRLERDFPEQRERIRNLRRKKLEKGLFAAERTDLESALFDLD